MSLFIDPDPQQVDAAVAPDKKSKPARSLIVLGSTVAALLLSSAWVVVRRYRRLVAAADPGADLAWRGLRQAWRFGR